MSEFPAPPPQPQPGYTPPPTYGTSGPSGPRASFGRRFVAWLVDVILLGIVIGVIQAVTERLVADLVGFAIGLLYYSYLEGSNSGQTIGKRALGIRVIDFGTGGPIGFGRAVIRYLGRIVSTIPCFLGYFWMLWDKERQCWHDKFANDVVVPVESYPVASWPN
jgi:uncharacterized RDD family membrane protein YckC